MTTFKISFVGRLSGAIGIVYKITETYKANSVEEFKSKLTMDYDVRRITSIKGCTIDEFDNAKIIEVRDKSERLRNGNDYIRPEKTK